MSTVLPLHRADDAGELAAALLNACPDRRVFTLDGPLGAGKTTLIKALCAQLGVVEGTSSPSFAIVNEYRDTTGAPVYHFDLYRLRDANELEGIGFTEYLDSGHYCFVEWPELAKRSLPLDAVAVRIRIGGDEARIVELDITPATMNSAQPA